MPENFQFFEGRVALVTGGASGIGEAITSRLVELGARVAVWDVRDDLLEALAATHGDRILVRKVDVGDVTAVDEAAEDLRGKWGGIDHLVNNAGIIGKRMTVAETDRINLERVLTVNVMSAFHVSSAFIRVGGATSQRSIVNLSSTAARTGGAPGSIAYATSKGAITSFTYALAKELSPDIRVNAVAPGIIDTKIQADVFADLSDMETFAATIPLRRLGSAMEVSNAAVWLLSDQAAYITGSVLDVTGGR